MVKVNYEDFVSKVDKLFSESKEKHSLYFTFKRLYTENFKYKNNRKIRKQRNLDISTQQKDMTKQYNVLCRVKLNKHKVQTIVEPNDITKFQNILMKIFSLHFITSKNEPIPKVKVNLIKKKSATQKRKDKKLKRLSLIQKVPVSQDAKVVS